MQRVQLYIPEELAKLTKKKAKQKKISWAEYLRRLLKSQVETEQKLQINQNFANLIGKFNSISKNPNAASEHNDIYTI